MCEKMDFTLEDLDVSDIRSLDKDNEWEEFFIQSCGLDFELYYFHDNGILTHDILENHLDSILDQITKFKDYIDNRILRPDPPVSGYWVLSVDDIYVGFQILGLLILMTETYLPIGVYDSIMYSTRWKYDRTRNWSPHYSEHRKNNLKIFRSLIQSRKDSKL